MVFSTSYRFAQTCAIHCVAFILGRKGDFDVVSKDKAVIGNNEQKDAFLTENNVNLKSKGVTGVDLELDPQKTGVKGSDGSKYVRGSDGIIYNISADGKTITQVAGITHHIGNWFFDRHSYIYMSPSGSKFFFAVALNHEFIHAFHHLKIGNSTQGFEKFSENSAYTNTNMYINSYSIPVNDGGFKNSGNLLWPSDLIRIQH